MPRGKKKTDNVNISAEAVTKPAAKSATTKKTRTTKAKAAPTTAKAADKSTKKVAKKTASKTAAPKVEIVAPKAAPKSEKNAAPKKTSAPATKRTPRKSSKDTGEQVILQGKNEYTFAAITEMCKKAYRNGTKKQIKTIKIYVKAEKNTLKAYYVVNDSVSGSVTL